MDKISNLKKEIINTLDSNKALDIVSIDLEGKSSIADFMIIASGTSSRHIQSLSEQVFEKIKSNGIVIATEKSAKVKTVFKGVVLSVLKFRGSNPTVLVQHGNYITAYKNLAKVFVEKGDNLDSGQVIGEVYNNESSGKSTLQFSVFKKTTPLNPIYWILKM